MKPILLDLFCGQGGASMGYHQAGFDIIGVDLFDDGPQQGQTRTRYPFDHRREDAITTLVRLLVGEQLVFTDRDPITLDQIAAIHASPPCQAYSITKHTHHNTYPDLLAPTRWLLRQTHKPHIIENVVGAPLDVPYLLCGTAFNLLATDTNGDPVYLRRHRLFETTFDMPPPLGCRCAAYETRGLAQVAGVYGGGADNRNHAKYVRRGGYTPAKTVREHLMGIDWMSMKGLSQAIPPAYTQYLGTHLMKHLEGEACSSPDPSATTTT